jgi:hypothetical protein
MPQAVMGNKVQLFGAVTRKLLGAAAVVFAAGGFLAVPAHADATCTVPGQYLNLHQSNGYDIVVSANGATLGPTGLARATPELATYGDVSGGIQGRNIDFTITWSDNKGQAHFTGTVGDDGVAHGTSTGPSIPVNLWNPGPWDSDGPLTCTPDTQAAPKLGPAVSWDPIVGGLVAHITDRSGVSAQCTYTSDFYTRSFFLQANSTHDLKIVPAIPEFRNWNVNISCDNGTSTQTTTFF